MEYLEILGSIPAALIPAAIIYYFQNQNNIRWMEERKALAEAVLAERKEWQAWQERTIERQFTKQDAATEAIAGVRGEMHATRGQMTALTLKVDAVLMRLSGDSDAKNTPRTSEQGKND